MRKILLFLIIIPVLGFSRDLKLIKVINSDNRKQINIQRDQYRNPYETLSFFEIKQNMNVLEILPGKGWYTEILSAYLKENGKLTVASFGNDNKNKYLQKIHLEFEEYFNANKKNFGKINIIKFKDDDSFLNMQKESQDLVLTFRNSHNWVRNNTIEEIYKAIWNVLKFNSVLGVVQHKANDNSDFTQTHKKGYLPKKYLIDLIEDQGFKFVDEININRNNKDTKDYEQGVWTLPPTLRLGEVEKEKYINIGESDRMTLKFIKIKK